jgi:hypothetical protein
MAGNIRDANSFPQKPKGWITVSFRQRLFDALHLLKFDQATDWICTC